MGFTTASARLLAGIAAVGLLLTGCAAGPADQAGEHDDADITFVQSMIPHHRQAVEMADLVGGRSRNAGVVDLAARIGAGQQPEIDTMTGWLQEWGAETPADGDAMGGMDHGDMGGSGGMMTPEQMQGLVVASGPAFDRMFLEMMTAHHRGAVEMARIELRDGADPDALALARTIVDTQQAEITEMEMLLQQL